MFRFLPINIAYDPSTGEIVLLPSLLTEGELTLEAEGVLDVMDLQLEGDAVSWPQEQTAIRNADFAMQVQAKNGYKLAQPDFRLYGQPASGFDSLCLC